MQKYGLIGWPVTYSVSPQMQNAGFRALGIDATYELVPVEPADVAERVDALRRDGWCGWNVTVPHKGAMAALVDTCEATAAAIESVNTVVNRDGQLHGYSTDGYGLETAIAEHFGVPVAGRRFLFWGTGGAARATATHFAISGAAGLILVNRTVSKAEALAATIGRLAPSCQVMVLPAADEAQLKTALPTADVVIQATSIGIHADDPVSMPPALLTPEMRLMDMIYKPTKLLAAAAAGGCKTANGRAMLLHQGVRSFEIWTGRPGPVAAMRAGLDLALDG